jgi:hypothetical protein
LRLAGEFAEEFPLVHAVLEGFAAVDENDGDFIVKLAADFVIGINVDFTPGEAALAGKLDQAFLDDFAEMASLAGVNHDLAGVRHGRDFSRFRGAVSSLKWQEIELGSTNASPEWRCDRKGMRRNFKVR